ncbi:MAG: nicotinate phosphoribosyltransferase [Actinomycetota bacterium]
MGDEVDTEHPTPDEVWGGLASDAGTARTAEVLRGRDADPLVTAEIKASVLPAAWPWMLVAGTEEVLGLLTGQPVDVAGLPEGSVAYPEEPVLVITGRFLGFAEVVTPILGTMAQATGTATAAARAKLAAGDRPVYALGARRLHPAVAAVMERAAFLGGCEGVTTVRGVRALGSGAFAPIDHDLALVLGVPDAWLAFDKVVAEEVPRVATVDTILDERAGAVAAAEALGERLSAVRLDVGESIRPDLPRLLREVRWELDARGHPDVRIVVTGNLSEEDLRSLVRYADAFGVDTPLAAAPPVPFELELVEVDGRPIARRGGLSGRKTLWRCENCGNRGITPGRSEAASCPRCGGSLESLLAPMLARGGRRGPAWRPAQARARALREAAAAGAR